MQTIQLDAIPNQSFSVRLDNARYDITIKETRGVMSASIARDNETIVDGARIVAGTPLLPYIYQEDGNFFLLTDAGDLPEYTKFGVTQNLVYLTIAEVEEYRGAN